MNDESTAPVPQGRRVEALGDELVKIHDMLRGEPASLRRDLAAADGGEPGPEASLEQQLRKKCLSFCEFLHGHHTAGDGRLLPGLAGSHPGRPRPGAPGQGALGHQQIAGPHPGARGER